jgi:hypothetical protein
VGSVKFVLDGVARTENTHPYTLAGETPLGNGLYDYKPANLPPGTHKLTATAYSGPNATGTASNVISLTFTIVTGSARLAAEPGPEAGFAQLTAAPNPFNGRTTLSFTATEDGPATLAVYNGQGLPVQQLFAGNLEKGRAYAWEFNGSTHPSGLYFARLKAGNQVLHQRLVLTK